MSASRKRKARRAYFAGLDAYAPLEERYVDVRSNDEALPKDDNGNPVGTVRLYQIEVDRGRGWRLAGEYGDVAVAANYALAMRHNGTRAKVVSSRGLTDSMREDFAPLVEARPSGDFAPDPQYVAGRPQPRARKRDIRAAAAVFRERNRAALDTLAALTCGLTAISKADPCSTNT